MTSVILHGVVSPEVHLGAGLCDPDLDATVLPSTDDARSVRRERDCPHHCRVALDQTRGVEALVGADAAWRHLLPTRVRPGAPDLDTTGCWTR